MLQRDRKSIAGSNHYWSGNREAGLFDMYVRVVQTGAPAQHVFFYSAEGIRAWFQNTAVPLGDGFAVTFRDITQQKEAEEYVNEHQAEDDPA